MPTNLSIRLIFFCVDVMAGSHRHGTVSVFLRSLSQKQFISRGGLRELQMEARRRYEMDQQRKRHEEEEDRYQKGLIEEFQQRVDAQINDETRRRLSDIVVENNGSLEDLRRSVNRIKI